MVSLGHPVDSSRLWLLAGQIFIAKTDDWGPRVCNCLLGRGGMEVRVVAGLSEGELMVRAEGRVLVEKSV